jgi:Smg protein
MTETMVDVLIYLFENYMAGEENTPIDQHELEQELSQAGFGRMEIAQALSWLDELAERMSHGNGEGVAPRGGSMRVFTEAEQRKLERDGCSLLMFLEQSGILDPLSRELVIDRALAIRQAAISVEELKWIVLLVLMNRPGQEQAFFQMEDLVYDEPPPFLH